MGGSSSVITITNQTSIDLNEYVCSDKGLILPLVSEYTWYSWIRIILYFALLMYLFLGIAIIADIFMCAIEKITSKTVTIKDTNDDGDLIERKVKVWNATVANLTLMALGSSSPEILLSIIEICGNKFKAGDLGPGTIVGSAAYNLLMITALCVVAIKNGNVRRIKNYKVFVVTALWSVFAYSWLYLVLVVISPNVVSLWEAILTLLFFPLVVLNSYAAEKDFWMPKFFKSADDNIEMNINDMSKWQRKKAFEDISDKVSGEDVLKIMREIEDDGAYENEDEKAKLIAAEILKSKQKSRLHYRLAATRFLSGGRSNTIEEPKQDESGQNDEQFSNARRRTFKDRSENGSKAVVEFSNPAYAVLENEGSLGIKVVRYGKCDEECQLRIESMNGTALEGSDYQGINEEFVMEPNENEKEFHVTIIDNDIPEPDKVFFLRLTSLGYNDNVLLGKMCMVTIIDDDEPGEIEFSESAYVVKESHGRLEVECKRNNGASGEVSVSYKAYSEDGSSKSFEATEGVLEFGPNEMSKSFFINIIDDKTTNKNESFNLELSDPQNGVKLGKTSKAIVTVINDNDLSRITGRLAVMVNADLEELSVTNKSWTEQFQEALNVNGGKDIEKASIFEYFKHVVSFPWKVMFAFVPPPQYLGGWLCFFVSLAVIGMMTAIVGDAAAIFGCLVGLKDSVTAISFVAMGTSLPDTFASMIAAQKELTADNAIGNVTGSNSVNVFLGLGLPWVVASIYWLAQGQDFEVQAGSLTFSIIIFTIAELTCLAILVLRRYIPALGRGELGGPAVPKYLTAAFLAFLWIAYITLSSLQAYGIF